MIAQINAQLLKLVDVVAVEDMTSGDHLARELLLIKLQIAAEHVDAVGALLRPRRRQGAFRQSVELHRGAHQHEIEIGEFIASVAAFGEIVEVVRSGVLGIARANPRMQVVK